MKSQPILKAPDDKGQSSFQLAELNILLTFLANKVEMVSTSLLASNEVIKDTESTIFVVCVC